MNKITETYQSILILKINDIILYMEPESEPQVEGTLVNDQVLITKKEMQQSLELKGYGEISKSKFFFEIL